MDSPLLIALSLFIVYLSGLGLLPLLLFPGLKQSALEGRKRSPQMIALVLGYGIALDYALVLLFQSTSFSFYAGIFLSLLGFASAFFMLRMHLFQALHARWFIWGLVLYLFLLFSGAVLYEPLAAWDARSIWFFQGRLIYFNRGFHLAIPDGWNNPALIFSHGEYPKLIPVLAARSAQLAGFWNEYVPKASLLILLLPTLFAATSFFERIRLSALFLILSFYFSLGWMLWNGYSDGYFGLFAVFACMYAARWLETADPLDLLSGSVFLSIAVSLKNEGLLFALLLTAGVVAVVRFSKKTTKPPKGPLIDRWKYGLLLWLPFLGFFIWTVLKKLWGLQNDLELGTGTFLRVFQRIEKGQIPLILKSLLIDAQVMKAAILFGAAFGAAKIIRARPAAPILLPLSIGLFYFLGIFVIYAGTPKDLEWHLGTSAGRTMLPVLLALFASIFFLMQGIEGHEGPQPAGQKKDAAKESVKGRKKGRKPR